MANNVPFQTLDIRGISKLAFNAVDEITHIVEGIHLNISNMPLILGQPETGPARGATGLIYRLIRSISGSIGVGIDSLLQNTQQASHPSSFQRSPIIAVLNGVLGDFLESTQNPLAIDMSFCSQGKPINLETDELNNIAPKANNKIMIFLHGLCTNDVYWTKSGGKQPELLAAELGFTPIFLRYNTGRHISTNGREFAEQLEKLIITWPVTPQEIVLVGYSMGGLVLRSACFYAELLNYTWRQKLQRIYFIGVPHHGSHVERGGQWVHHAMGISPYTFPLSRLAAVRSAGITDLRYGNLLDDDWLGLDRFHRTGDKRHPLPLPCDVACYSMAATVSEKGTKALAWGDGFVGVASALGIHEDERFHLAFPAEHCSKFIGMNHFELVSKSAAYDFIRNNA